MFRSSVVIVSPSLAAANNGNWQTARRWATLLRRSHAVRITTQWPDGSGSDKDTVMLALHAARSADAIQAWSTQRGRKGLGVVLTGTDLYGEFAGRPEVQRSMELAQRLVVLQEDARVALPDALRGKARVIHASGPARATLPKSSRCLRAVAVGHLRDVKGPGTLFEAARRLDPRAGIQLRHIGDAQGHWADDARATEAASSCYRWLGALPHAQACRWIQRAHVLVHPSLAEGGAHVVMEAVRCGTPVLASRIAGNVGMLGADYEGYFEPGDAAGLATLLLRCRAEQDARGHDPAATLLGRLRAQCQARAPLFDPAREREALLHLVHDLQDPR
ncbi:selenoneine biosynthesis selenosugar synthase SenB [Ramlibacter sp. MMS24-I3-19]|uniref:selenoneine biosynthesis selenosugar synthase SenB n=1 Tax=Ramlibacter sp. MMS24-I3-19 TaxID=3416606 RepID=UPI003CFCF728